MYYPKALSKTRITFLLFLKAVFDNIKQTKATSKGTKTTAVVKLKFYKNLEKRKIPLGWFGLNLSSSWLLLRELYPLTNLREESAAKQGFTWDKVTNAKKLICTTAII